MREKDRSRKDSAESSKKDLLPCLLCVGRSSYWKLLDLLTFDFPISCAPVPSLTTLLSLLHPRHSFVTLVLNEEQMASQGNAAGQQQAVGQQQQQPVVNGAEACVWFEASKIYRRRAADPND
ncbi:hypothetical protein PI126_g4513 [Phytophthora idaei]|nr:hypothetical protein PI126_g4513 [Phytophthora idaei]